MHQYFGRNFDVSNALIKMYTKDFEILKDYNMRDDLDGLRNAVYQVLVLSTSNPKILEKKMYYEDFINALAIKDALTALNILHDD